MTTDLFWIRSIGWKQEHAPADEALIARTEADLEFRLPAAYLTLMRAQNGGYTRSGTYLTPDGKRVTVAEQTLCRLQELGTLREHLHRIEQEPWYRGWAARLADPGRIVPFTLFGDAPLACFDYQRAGPGKEPSILIFPLRAGGAPVEISSFETLLEGLIHDWRESYWFGIAAEPKAEKRLVKELEAALGCRLSRRDTALLGADPRLDFGRFHFSASRALNRSIELRLNETREGELLFREQPEMGWLLRAGEGEPGARSDFKEWICADLAKLSAPVTPLYDPPVGEYVN